MTSRDVTLLNSFVDYVLDVKPYHSKIKQFLSELFFNDNFNVNITDKLDWTLYNQNQWSVNDVDGYQLQRLCEGLASDVTFKLPAAIWPRFSITDNFQQQPLGDDPVVWDGIVSSSSHFLGVALQTDYLVPFHQGSRVYVNEIPQEYNVDYTVDTARSYIRFAVAPAEGDQIEVQLFKVDRLFVAFNYAFDFAVNRDYDMFAFDMLPFDSSEDLIGNDADAWNIVVDSSFPHGHWPIVFYNAYPQNHAKAALTLNSISGANGDVWRITAIGPWSFKVQKNQTGQVWFAYFKTPFDNGQISFVIDKVWSDYYLIPDSNTYDTAWSGVVTVVGKVATSLDLPIGSVPGDAYYTDDTNKLWVWDGSSWAIAKNSAVDQTDFFVDLNTVTQHGAVVDPTPPVQRPMEFVMKSVTVEGFDDNEFNEPEASFTPSFTIGRVKLITENTLNGPADYYAFVLDQIPSRGTYVEFRVEQNGQLNPWINTKIEDDMYMQVSWPADTITDQLDPTDPFSQATVPYTIPAGTIKLIHNINLANSDAPPVPAMGSLSYTETQAVSELVLYHNLDNYYDVTITDGSGPVVLPYMYLRDWVHGAMLPPDFIGVDKQRIIINLATARPITVTIVLTPLPTPVPTPTPTPPPPTPTPTPTHSGGV